MFLRKSELYSTALWGIVLVTGYGIKSLTKWLHQTFCKMIFFSLISGQIVENENFDTPLTELGLIPTSILNFAWHPEVADEVKQQLGPNASYLKDSILALAKSD